MMASSEKVAEAMIWYDKNIGYYQRCAESKMEIIRKILNKRKIPFHSINYRAKERTSFEEKCKSEKYKDPIKEIMDLSGIRVIAYTNKDVLDICEIIEKEFDIDSENSMNKSDKMREDQVGYLSVHYIVKLKEERTRLPEYEDYKGMRSEIQVRTLLQHAWAEIEHDRNYKFAGVLPKEIQRRFYLLAGTLEMIDREFDALSKEIDNYAEKSLQKVNEGDYDISIDSKSLEQYLIQRFGDNEVLKRTSKNEIITEEVTNEIIRFGCKTIRDLDNIIKKEYLKHAETYLGLLRNTMVISDAKKYFTKAYAKGWSCTDKETIKFWQESTTQNIQEYIHKYDIVVF